MASRNRTTIVGLDGLRRELRQLGPRATEGIKRAIRDSAGQIAANAGMHAPRDTGALAASFDTEIDGDGLGANISWGEDAFHGLFQEFGTSRHAAQPSLGPAAEQERLAFPRRVAREIQRELGE